MRARVTEKREAAKGTLLVLFDFLGEDVAGPPATVDAIVETLHAAGVSEERVSADRFSGY